jgi:hypothetical protein
MDCVSGNIAEGRNAGDCGVLEDLESLSFFETTDFTGDFVIGGCLWAVPSGA